MDQPRRSSAKPRLPGHSLPTSVRAKRALGVIREEGFGANDVWSGDEAR